MADVTANLNIQGKSSGFTKSLESGSKALLGLNKEVKVANKGFLELNKNTKQTSSTFTGMVKGISGAANEIRSFSRTTKSFYTDTKNTSQTVIDLNDSLDSASRGFSGLGLRLAGFRDETIALNSILDGPAGHLRDIAEASSNTERSFIILDKAEKPLIKGLSFLSTQAEKASKSFVSFEKGVVSATKGISQVGVVALNSLNSAFTNLEQSFAGRGLLGKIISNQLGAITTSISTAKLATEDFANSLDPSKFSKADEIGNKLSSLFLKSSNVLDKTKVGVQAADFAGDIYRAGLSVGEFVKDNLIPLGAGLGTSAVAFKESGIAAQLFSDKLSTTQTIAKGVDSSVKQGLVNSLAKLTLKTAGTIALLNTLQKVGDTIIDVTGKVNGLGDAFGVFNKLGINTQAAESVLQFGLLGEKLLFNTQAAKEFGQAAVAAFAQLEDAVGFVTTLSAGTNAVFKDFEKGSESISAAVTELVNGPLRNAITSGEAAGAVYNALSAGIGVTADGVANLSSSFNFLEASSKLAAASGADANVTLEALAKTSQIYGRSNLEAEKTAVQLYGIVEKGITTFPQLAGGIARTAGVAKASGVAMEELGGIIAALTISLGSTDDSLTGISSLLGAIAGQGEQSRQAVEDLGVKFDIATIKSQGLVKTLQDLYTATNGNITALKTIIPDQLAFQTALSLMTTAGTAAAENMEYIAESGENAGEILDELFGNRQQTIIQRTTNLMNGFNEVLVEFGTKALPILEPGLNFLEKMLDVIQSLPEPVKNLIGGLILFQATIGRAFDGIASIAGLFGKIIISSIAFNLATKTLTGQLGKELDILKQLAFVEKDGVGFITRLIGLNKDYTAATVALTTAKRSQLDLEKTIQASGVENLGLLDGVVESYKVAAAKISKEIENLKKSGLQFASPKEFQKQLTTLKKLESQITLTGKKVAISQKSVSEELVKNIEKIIVDSSTTIDQKRPILENALNSAFSIFGVVGAQSKEKFGEQISEILNSGILTAEEKAQQLRNVFKNVLKGTPASFQAEFSKVASAITIGNQELDKVQEKYKQNIRQFLLSIGTELGDPKLIKKIEEDLSENFDKVFLGLNTDLQSRRVEVTKTFERIFEQLPDSVKKTRPQLFAALENLFGDLNVPIKKREESFKQALGEVLKGADKEVINYIPKLSQTMIKLVKALEEPLSVSSIKREIFLEKFQSDLEKTFQTLKNTSSEVVVTASVKLEENKPEVERQINIISEVIKTKFKELSPEIQSSINQIGQSLNKELEKIKISENLNLEEPITKAVEKTLISLEKIRSGEITLERFNQEVKEQSEKINLNLQQISNDETREKIKAQVKQLRTQVVAEVETLNVQVEGKSKDLKTSLSNSLFSVKSGIFGLLGTFAPGLLGAVQTVDYMTEVLKGLKEGTQELQSQNRNLAGSQELLNLGLENSDQILNKNSKSIKNQTGIKRKLSQVNRVLDTDLGKLNLRQATNIKLSGAGAKSSSLLLKAQTALGSATTALTSGLSGLTTLLGNLSQFLAPILAKLAVLTGGLLLLKTLVLDNIPGIKRFTNGFASLSFEIEKVNKEFDKLTFKDFSEIEKAPKAFAQGWRAAIVNVTESITNLFLNTGKKLLEFRAFLGNKSFIGRGFKKITGKDLIDTEDIKRTYQQTESDVRNFFNKRLREPLQEANRNRIRKQFAELQQDTGKLAREAIRQIDGFKLGEANTSVSKQILQKALSETRALTAEELGRIQKLEADATKKQSENISKRIETLTKLQEKTKDPAIKQDLQAQIDLLQEQASALEQTNKQFNIYLQNLNALAGGLQAADNTKSNEAFLKGLEDSFNSEAFQKLPEKEKQIFQELLKVRGEFNEETKKFSFESTGLNISNKAQRRAAESYKNALTEVLDSGTEALQVENQEDIGKITQDIESLFTASAKAVEEGVITSEEAALERQKIFGLKFGKATNDFGKQFEGKNIFDALGPQAQQQIQDSILQDIQASADRQIAVEQNKIDQISALQATGQVSNLIALNATAEAQSNIDQESLKAKKQILDETIQFEGENSSKVKRLRRELATFELQIEANRFNNRKAILEEEQKLLEQQLDNELQIRKNAAQKEIGNQELERQAIDQLQKVADSQRGLSQATANFEETLLQNKLKLTGDIEEKGRIELQLAEQRAKVSEQELEFEKENIKLQQKLNDLALERQSIELNISQLETQKSIREAQARLEKADELKLTKEEKEALELQVQASEQQVELIGKQRSQLEDFKTTQKQINQDQLKALNLRERAARESNAVEIQLAQRNAVLASYDKEIQKIRLAAQISDLTSQQRIQSFESQTAVLESQTKILEEQKNLVSGTQDIIQRGFQLAISGERNAFKRRKLEQEAAKIRLVNLQRMQEFELRMFEIQQLQNKLALERRKIELDIAKVKAEAELRVAEAEAQKVLADESKTDLERQASLAQVDAARAGVNALGQQRQLLDQEAITQGIVEGLQRQQLQQRQQVDVLDARAGLAQTTISRTDDRQVAADALNLARNTQNQLPSLFQGFSTSFESLTNQLGNALQQFQNQSGSTNTFQQLNGNVGITIKFEGDTSLARGAENDPNLQRTIQEGVYQGLNGLFDYYQRRN